MKEPDNTALFTEVETSANVLQELMGCVRPLLPRKEVAARLEAYVYGLLGEVERRNSWQLAEYAGDAKPYGFQHLLCRSRWDEDAVCQTAARFTWQRLRADNDALILDETGFLKKGTHSAGVQRQYSGTAGRIENCQIGVFLAYASVWGHSLLDRRLYLPDSWVKDPTRCREAGIPPEVHFRTKPELGQDMLAAARQQGISAKWVLGDSVYGGCYRLRRWLEERDQAYVMAVGRGEYLRLYGYRGRVSSLIPEIPAKSWVQVSVGAGSKGERLYDWAVLIEPCARKPGWQQGVLFRRSPHDPENIQAFLLLMPESTTPLEAIEATGLRWAIEMCFEEAKQQVGLDEYEVRTWHAWYRHITLAILAHSFLVLMKQALLKKQLRQMQSVV